MSYLVSKRSWTKKITVSLTIALVLNPFAAVLGLNNKMVNAAEGTYNNSDNVEQSDASSFIPQDPSYTSESVDDNIAQTEILEPLSVTDNVYGYFNLSSQVVISKIYGGGSQNADALYQYDFIELYNPTDAPVDVTNWSVQYAVSSAKADDSSWQVTPLTGTISARGHYLIQESGKPALTGKELPTPDAIGMIDLDNKDGKVALVSDATPLTVVNPTKQAIASFVDFVGYGAAKSFYGLGAAPANSAQKGIVRYALDPLDPSLVTKTSAMAGSAGELYGNSWNTHNNTEDFEQAGSSSLIVPRNASYLTPMSVSVDDSIRVQMDSLNTISATHNHFTVALTTGEVKEGSLTADDYVITGLPAGIHVIGALGNVVNNTITFTLGGTATVDVKSDVPLSVMIKKSANTLRSYDDSGTVSGITLYSNTPKVKGEVTSNTLSMTEPTKATGSLSIHLTTGTVKNGPLLDTDYTMTGLPSGLSIQASGDTATNTVTFTISGATLSPVTAAMPLTVTLKASAVTTGASLDSDPIDGVTLDRYKKPVQADEVRKATLTQRIKEANAYYNNPDNKSYKYSVDGMAGSSAAFYRGSPYMYYQDLGSVISLPKSWKELTNVKTWIEGDAHVANVGYYDDKFGKIVFDLNDYDGAYIAPFYLDLLRMTSSLYLTRDAENLPATDAEIRDIAKVMLEDYMKSLESLVGNNNKNTDVSKLSMNNMRDGFTKTLMAKLEKKTQLDHLIKWTVPTSDKKHSTGVLNVDGKSDKYRKPTADERAEVELNWQQYVGTITPDFANARLAENADYFKIKDVAVRIYQGLGSIGSQRYNVLIEGPTVSHDDDIILDVKQAFQPDMFDNAAEAQTTPYGTFPGGDGAKVKTAYEKMSLDAEGFLGYFESKRGAFFVHKISLYKGDYEDAPGGIFKTKENLADYVSYISKAYAFAHARSAENKDDTFERSILDQVYKDDQTWNNFQTELLNLGEDYYKQVKSDYTLMKQDMIDGKLIDVAVLNGLTISNGSLAPEFDENKLNYTVAVSKDVASIDVTATALDSKATIKIKGVTYTSGTPKSITLSTGINVIDVVVSAQDATTNKTYTIRVTRQGATGGGNDGNSGNNGNNGSVPVTTTKPKEEPTVAEQNKNTVVIDAAKIQAVLAELQATGNKEQNLVFNLPNTNSKDTDINMQLPLKVLEEVSKARPNAVLTFNTGVASYSLPIQAIDFTKLAKELGVPTATSTVTLHVSQVTGQKGNAVQESLKAAGLNGISVPVDFTLQVEANGKKVEVNDFGNRYVSRVIPYVSNESLNELVVVRINADGTVSVMPATFAGGKVTVYSQSNSIYVVAHTQSRTFADISKHWAKSEIELLASKRIIQGTSAQTFSPDATMTRAEFTMLMSIAFALKDNVAAVSFSDVSKSAWYAGAVGAAYKAGIITGFTDGGFHPNQAMTREQMAVMIVKAAELSGKSLRASNTSGNVDAFKDASQISTWAQDAVEATHQAGIINGDGNGNFSPTAPVTRAQAAVMFKQLLQAIQFMN
ncbi:DUF2252 family protein [Paenibacillus macquariensis]|uniref:Uncharacterized conserved protein, DUF2252 family n=1 Tax=Paenibacillus macquariensis TaxID=948756 RepID=A0ABY1K3H1_9BACL|nr:DUF2252 family protein [Paenibacillus macquariensis]OAB39732.1 hypothetical protein PMSM_00980 [Paenibacillus macquariensis subsp. macquariensis]SIR20250.1 Uncharacterized conserved protein, DUF2252 family [Paenibacillus macquariensis]